MTMCNALQSYEIIRHSERPDTMKPACGGRPASVCGRRRAQQDAGQTGYLCVLYSGTILVFSHSSYID